MENYEIADILKHTAKLMELHGENAFKIRSFQNASFKLDRLADKLEGKSVEELEKVDGIGKSLSVKIYHLLSSGNFPELDALKEKTPDGVLEMMSLKGIGPKKVATLWQELNIETIGELLYACNENRLIELKGFGTKTQEQVKQAVEFKLASQGHYHYATVEVMAIELIAYFQKNIPGLIIQTTGDLRRKCEIIDEISLIAICNSTEELEKIKSAIKICPWLPEVLQMSPENELRTKSIAGPIFSLILAPINNFPYTLWKSTGSNEHIHLCLNNSTIFESELLEITSEELIYQKLTLDFIEPELREGLEEVNWSKQHALPTLVNVKDLKGILHNHSTYSDGIHSLLEMATTCRDLGYEYLGICDHSKSAFYANGLSIERVQQQHIEIEKLNSELAPFKIFKGIESDILNDGLLDYPTEVLSSFDFIVASIHSNLKMTEEKATERLLTAIRNPFTTILGHPTGRLLLARKGYPINHKLIIDACAEHGVVIELNAHPYRLDLDWRWIQYALSKNVMISINPDAHAVEGYQDMHFGVCVARKGALTKDQTFNAFNKFQIEEWFQKRRDRCVALK